jgi:branched-chain amino acid transport system permease protein
MVCGAVLAVAIPLQVMADANLFPDVLNPYYLHLLTIMGMNIILVASLNLLNGYLGEFALGHAGFMAVGAYTAALVATRILPPTLALPPVIGPLFTLGITLGGAMLAAALVGYLIGLLTFKTVGDYLAIITLGFNMIIVNAIQNIDLVGGPRGFTGIPKNTNLLAVVVCAVLTLAVLRNLIQSSFGRVWVSIRENAIASELMGVNLNRAKNQVFTIAAAFAGLAGGLWAQNQQFITPRSFDYIKTTEILVMLYLGGMASLSGSILGVVAYTILMELLRNLLSTFAPHLAEWRMLISPLILIVIMLTRQFGLMGNREWRWLRPREGA